MPDAYTPVSHAGLAAREAAGSRARQLPCMSACVCLIYICVASAWWTMSVSVCYPFPARFIVVADGLMHVISGVSAHVLWDLVAAHGSASYLSTYICIVSDETKWLHVCWTCVRASCIHMPAVLHWWTIKLQSMNDKVCGVRLIYTYVLCLWLYFGLACLIIYIYSWAWKEFIAWCDEHKVVKLVA